MIKDAELLQKIRKHIRDGTYVLAKHAIARQLGRHINLPEVLFVLEHGRHEVAKDVFDVKRQTWRHAISGKTADGGLLRVIVAFEEEMAIITVIRL